MLGTRDTAHQVGSGRVTVLATPGIVMLLEEAALQAVDDFLPPRKQTMGTRLGGSHLIATPVGMRVVTHAEVTDVAGRKLTRTLAILAREYGLDTDSKRPVLALRRERLLGRLDATMVRLDE